MERLKSFLFIIIFLLPVLSFANRLGMTLSPSLYSTEPEHLHGAQLMLKYEPGCLNWQKFNLYFDGGFSYFHASDYSYHKNMSIYSAAPVFRYTLKRDGFFLPYCEVSIGFAYLNHTRMAHRNLGIHYSFQDRIGIGAWFGQSKKFSLGIHTVHYSNAHLSGHNSGITIPIVLDLTVMLGQAPPTI